MLNFIIDYLTDFKRSLFPRLKTLLKMDFLGGVVSGKRINLFIFSFVFFSGCVSINKTNFISYFLLIVL
ncbi:hypothetical protein SAMN02982990_04462 [Photorhabdus luminescens]|uniref:Uncharacterized protein n=1 Tax=Photorhabdus luminescens TaxID=29488 RepID=A0A1G5RKJ4_PHOLU|nr:hypothetical protein SAMN02982990_04462 [Photorhabdus luminescens]